MGRYAQVHLNVMLNAQRWFNSQQALATIVARHHEQLLVVVSRIFTRQHLEAGHVEHLKLKLMSMHLCLPWQSIIFNLLFGHLDADVMEDIPQKNMAPRGTSISNKLG